MSLTLNTTLSLVPLEIRKEKKRFIIEDQFSGDFFEMPEICIDAINLINQGKQLCEIEQILKIKYPNEVVNILDFAEQLKDLNLIDSIDSVKIEKQEIQKEQLGFLWISSKIGKFFFNKFTYALYSSIFILNILLFLVNPSLFPQHKDIFVFDIMIFNVLLWMVFTFISVLFHEFGHVIAMRAYNLPTKLEIGHRMFFVVFETDMSTVWKLPSKDRNVLFLAGISFDSILLFAALIFQLFFHTESGIILGLINLAVFDIVLRMIFQCCFYMKTDLYFVLENSTGCYNLMENAKQTIRKKLSPFKLKLMDDIVFSGEKRTVSTFTVFYFLGYVITIALYFMYFIPEVIHAGKQLLPGFGKPPTSLAFWDAVLFTLQVGIFLLLLLYSYWKKYRPVKM